MSLETDYDAWVRGLMRNVRGTPAQAEAADEALRAMQAELDALSADPARAEPRPRTAEPRARAGAAADAVRHAADKTAENVRRMSSELARNLRSDGLLGRAPAARDSAASAAGPSAQAAQTAPAPPAAPRGSFAGLADAVRTQVLGQDAFVAAVVKAFRRPFVMGSGGPDQARGAMLLCGPSGSGRHYTLRCVVAEMAARGLLASDKIEEIDLALYPGPAQEKLFLQDLYAALRSPAAVLAFNHYEACAPAFRTMLATLATEGQLALASRYVLQRGILVDVGTALAPDAIGEMQAGGKYFVFFSEQDETALAGAFGAKFVDALAGDICRTVPFTPESLAAIAARELNFLAETARRRCGLRLTMGADLRDWLAGQYGKAGGMRAMRGAADRLFRALAEYVLSADPAPAADTPTALTVHNGRVMASVAGGEPFDLLALLPAPYRGDVEAVEAELDAIVGLAPVKAYVRDLAANVQAQQRRKAQGLPVAAINRHMIFTGNPGTGKTTIARILAKYLKAIGALEGGQLVEVSRADLVGRYVGHTAPLTNGVIRSALGGVLFIDEAYSLYHGEQDSFGLEAIDTLVKGIEDHRDEFVVILAGYTDEMRQFLRANSGLASRFPNQIEFPDYTADELWAITQSQAKAKGYALDPGCEAPLKAYFARRQAADPARAGNGRMARNLLERAILNQSRRLIADPAADLATIEPGDFELEEESAQTAGTP